MKIFLLFNLILGSFCLSACGGGSGGGSDGGGNTATSSSTNSTVSASSAANGVLISDSNKTSHNAGQNCLTCHKTGGSGAAKAIFKAAGTIYKSSNTVNANATVKLFLHNTNQISATLPTDMNGNFYTTQTVNGLFVEGGPLVDGVDAVVQDSFGADHTMPGVVSNGGCSSCHGASVGKITVN